MSIPPCPGRHSLNETGDRVLVGDVQCPPGQVPVLRASQVAGHDFRAGLGQTPANRQADPLRAARHHGAFAGQAPDHRAV